MANPFETHGMFSWFELMTTDVDKAKDFYGDLFDWQFQVDENPDMEYVLIRKEGGEPFAGIFDRKYAKADNKEQIPPHWGSYVTVDNAEATVQQAVEKGGNVIVPATPIPAVGIFAVLQDPQGAVFSIFEYRMEK